MQTETKPPREPDLRFIAIRVERESRLLEIIHTARADMAPRNFAERHLVDEMAIAKWRGLRTVLMEKAVYDHQDALFQPEQGKDADGKWVEPNEDIFHLAMAHATDRHAVVLAALSLLEARFHRQFCSALRLLLAMRRLNPFNPADAPLTSVNPETDPNTRKAPTPCNPSLSPA